jgi:alkylation response protein AidB-like acyl-CoA dehydrogenase
MLVEPYLGSAVLAGRLLAELGEGDTRDAMLGELMAGKLQLALASAERSARFNLASVATTATAEGDAILINGMKVAVLNAPAADKLLVVASESGDTFDESGISVFVVDAKTQGVTIQGFPNVDGRQSAEVLLENVRVIEADRLGAKGEAFTALESVVDRATVAVAAEAVGAMEALLAKTVEYSKTRKQFGVPIGTFQALQHRMADMFVECQLAKSIVVMAAMKLDSQEDATAKKKAVSAAKSRVGKAIRKVGQEAVQIHGGIGTTEELDVGHLFKSITGIEMLFGNTDYHTQRFAAL